MNKKSTLRSVANDYLTHSKSKSGITLVALIITIIVLLILAMVSIRLVMNGGIIDKSKNAVDKYSNEEIMEQIKLAYQEYQMSQYTDNPLTLQQAMDKSFGEGVATVSGDATNGWTVTVKGIAYPLSANGTVGEGEAVVAWTKNEDGSYTAGTGAEQVTIKIGDYVNYDPTKDATTGLTYKSEAARSGWNSDQTFDAATYKAAGYGWRVLDVQNGKVRLISEEFVGPGAYTDSNRTYYYLRGQKGYINGIEELNKISGIFGHGKGAASATSITVEDINAITGYNPATAKCGEGQWYEYGNKVTYTYNSENNYTATRTNGATAQDNTYTFNSSFNYYDSATRTFKPLTSGSKDITSTYYWYNPTTLADNSNAPTTGVDAEGNYTPAYSLLFGKWKVPSTGGQRTFVGDGNQPYFWLASDYAYAYYYYAIWGLRCVDLGDVRNSDLYHSSGNEYYSSVGVRPVVSLKSSVNLKWNATGNQWEIQ